MTADHRLLQVSVSQGAEIGSEAGSLAARASEASRPRHSALPIVYNPSSPANQRRITREAAERNGELIPGEFEFDDYRADPLTEQRPGFENALTALLGGHIKTLYVARLSLLPQSAVARLGDVLDELERIGGRVVLVAEGLDSSQPEARKVLSSFAAQARQVPKRC